MELEPKKNELKKIIDLINHDNIADAQRKIKEIILNFPKSVLSHNILGSIQMKLKDYFKAIKSFEKTINLKPDFKIGHNNLGLTYHKIKNYEKALLHFKKAIEIDCLIVPSPITVIRYG